MRSSALTSNIPLTFADYFKLDLDLDEVAAYFGYTYARQALTLPHAQIAPPWLADLQDRLQAGLPYISLPTTWPAANF